MTEGIEEPGTAPAAQPKPNSFQRIAGVLFSPNETFESIARRPDVLVPLLLVVILSYVSTAIIMPRMDFDAMFAQQSEAMRKQNPNMTDADIERAERIIKGSAKVMGWIGPGIMVAWYAIVAGTLLLAFRVMGGEGTYKQAFSATVYSWFPLIIFSIISTIVVLARGSFDPMTAATMVRSNLAFLVSMKEQPILFSLLGALDIFTIWTVVLLIIGFASLTRSSKAKSAAIVLMLWGIMIVIRLGFAALGAARMKA